MARLIDANALLVEVVKAQALEPNTAVAKIIMLVTEAERVDAVEVVHGRWIDNIDENGFLCNMWRKCSACGGLNYSKRPPYCPNCGAKMDGERRTDNA